MNTSFLNSRAKTFGLVLFFAVFTVNLPAQIVEEEVEYEDGYLTDLINLGENGIAVFKKVEKVGPQITRFGGDGKLLWNKTFTLPGKRTSKTCHASSVNGKDMYVLGFEKYNYDGGGSNPALLCIDAVTGEFREKLYTEKDFGNVLSLWANSKYLFVFTTYYEMTLDAMEKKDPGVKVYRFDKETMEMKALSHEMGNASTFSRVFWQVIRVEEDFVEAYVVKEATQHVGLTIARFDNEGKKIKSTDVSFDLREMFCRQVNSSMELPNGVSRDEHTQNCLYEFNGGDPKYTMIYPMTSCYMVFDPATQVYYAYGVCGPDEQRRLGSKYSGFFVAKIDADHKLVVFKEHAEVKEFSADKKFFIHEPAYYHWVSANLRIDGKLILNFATRETGLRVIINPADCSVENASENPKEHYGVNGIQVVTDDKLLGVRKEVTGKMKKSDSMNILVTPSRQFAVVIGNGYAKSIRVYSEAIR